jgi:sensor c-di-GMP phosphodiesterase-like protein
MRYLQQFPIDILKIDKSFVHKITADPTTLASSAPSLAWARTSSNGISLA